ncbi:MAG: ATP-binding protein [Allobaculum sp.]|nr:ATP-binding protein [Allobaculum sp.]
MWTRIKEARLCQLTINGIKNVENGVLNFVKTTPLKNIDQNITDAGHVFGIYGQNGSGKTAAVDACWIIRQMMLTESPFTEGYRSFNKKIKNLINSALRVANIEALFYLKVDDQKMLINYAFEFQYDEANETYFLSKEVLKRRLFQEERWGKEHTLIKSDYVSNKISIAGIRDTEKFEVVPKVLREKAPLSSVIFSETFRDFIPSKAGAKKDSFDLNTVLTILKNFSYHYFLVVHNNDLGSGPFDLMTLILASEIEDTFLLGKYPLMYEGGKILEDHFPRFEHIVKQTSFVLNKIVPGSGIEIEKVDKKIDEDQQTTILYECFALRNGMRFSLSGESEGIKRLITLIGAFIAFANKKEMILVIDEFDAGIFEYLFGEIVQALDSCGEGQIIFTAHNLRGLETLPYKQIFFSTLNPSNVYERQTTQANNNNRTTYFRNLILGKDTGEVLGNLPSVVALKLAFKRANRL